MLAAIQLDVFTPLSDGPGNVEQVAEAIGVDADKLGPLMYILVETGLLAVDGENFSNSPEANYYLVKGNASYMGAGYEANSNQWNALWKSADLIRTGSAQAKIDYSHSAPSKEALDQIARRGHAANDTGAARRLLAEYDFSSSKRLIDVARGTGGVAITIAQACPQLRATVVDLPSVTPITERMVQESGVADRVDVVAADVVNGTLEGSFDVAIISKFLPVISQDDAQLALKNVAQVMEPGGTLYVDDIGTIDDTRLAPSQIIRQNLFFINVFDDGQARTEQERREWLTAAGFENIVRKTFPNGDSTMVARKPK
ncbi:MAG: methyltransferase [Dehalococcoidia bacterium]|nr:methyltransferase [Dehalococcoidia bacterium]